MKHVVYISKSRFKNSVIVNFLNEANIFGIIRFKYFSSTDSIRDKNELNCES